MGTPALLTERCNGIASAINGNRVKKESGEVRFALPENLTRIIAVENYLQKSHVGFYAYGVEISSVFVMRCLGALAGGVVSAAPVLMMVVNIPTLNDIKWYAAYHLPASPSLLHSSAFNARPFCRTAVVRSRCARKNNRSWRRMIPRFATCPASKRA